MKTLQVKAELNKLGDAPRAYLEKFGQDESMMVDNSHGRLTIDSRFNKIEGVKPAGNQGGKTLRLMKPKQAGSRRY